jgi:hypothetical protein
MTGGRTQLTPSVARNRSSIACSHSLTGTAPNPMNPPSFVASAALGYVEQPATERVRFFGGRLRAEDVVHGRELVQHPRAGERRTVGLVSGQGILLLIDHRHDVLRHLDEQLLAGRRGGGFLQGRDRFVGHLDRSARIRQRDRHSRDERGAPETVPLLVGVVGLPSHRVLLPDPRAYLPWS